MYHLSPPLPWIHAIVIKEIVQKSCPDGWLCGCTYLSLGIRLSAYLWACEHLSDTTVRFYILTSACKCVIWNDSFVNIKNVLYCCLQLAYEQYDSCFHLQHEVVHEILLQRRLYHTLQAAEKIRHISSSVGDVLRTFGYTYKITSA